MVSFICDCGADVEFGDRFAGQWGRCPHCGAEVLIPRLEEAVPAPADETPAAEAPPPAAEAAVAGTPDLAAEEQLEGWEPAEVEAAERPTGWEPAAGQEPEPPSGGEPVPTLDDLSAAAGALHPSRAASQPRGGQGPWGARSVSGIGAIAGILILATIAIPWGVEGHLAPGEYRIHEYRGPVEPEVVMSWGMLHKAPGLAKAFVICAWLIGLAALATAMWFNAREHAVNSIIGLWGVLLMIAAAFGTGEPRAVSRRTVGPFASAPGAILAALVLAQIIVTNVALKLRPLPALRAIQAAVAVVMLAVIALGVQRAISEYAGPSEQYRRAGMLDFGFSIFTAVGLALACALAVVHAADPKIRRGSLSATSVNTIYLVLGVLCIYFILRPTIITSRASAALPYLNALLLVGPVLMLFCSGVINMVCELIGARRPGGALAAVSQALR